MIPRKTQGRGISGTVRYVLGEGKRDPVTGVVPQLAPGEKSRVAWFGGTGFGFPIDSEARLDVARRVMEWAAQNQASKTKQCQDDCLHLVLAWDADERPNRAEMEAAAHGALARLGMGHARAIFAAHDDTTHRHLHLVISRIDPENGKAFSNSFDTKDLSAWALDWERSHGGVRCEARLASEQRAIERDPEKVFGAFASRRETFTAFDLNRELTPAIPSRDTRRAFITALLTRSEMVRLADPSTGQVMRYTTRQTLAAEHLAAASAARLYGDRSHQVSGRALDGVLEELRAGGVALRPEQMSAVRHATRAEGLAVIAGKAGTGKSFAMSAIAATYAADGYSVLSLAPTNKVVTALQRDGLTAATLHSALGRLDRGELVWTGRSVVMVDEAGMVSTRLMARLLSHAEHAGAKVILVGDEKQLASMDRGGLFGYLAERYGAGELSEITRQRGAEQRELAMRASRYDFKGALAALDAAGGLITVERSEDRIGRAAELWGDYRRQSPAGSLVVVAVSNAEAQAANLAIRQIRRARGELGVDQMLATADGLQAFAVGDRILFSGSAASREGRAAGLVNGNAGTIAGIDGARMSVALDGARPGELVSFTVGPNREAGEFDAVRLGYAGTVYKAQGATYDRAIVLDSPNMRASTAYVALTRHREGVTVVTSPALQPGFESWMGGKGGFDALTPEQQARAAQSYETWRTARKPDAGERHGLADYVGYVQGREAARRAETREGGAAVAAMAKRWSRVDDRRAASRFEAIGYQSPVAVKMTPAEVRAAVGDEPSLRNMPDRGGEASRTIRLMQDDHEARRRVRTPEEAVMSKGPPTEEMLRDQAWQEARRLRDLGEQEQRAQAFRLAKELEAETARQDLDKKRDAEEGRGRDGDIGDAGARYAIALGETYDVRDPYASLARAAMSESVMLHRSQERMRQEMANEADPEKRRVIELRMRIEGCEYMAITSDRLAGISVAITGRADSEQAVIDRSRAEDFRALAGELRTERSALIEAGQDKGERGRETGPVDVAIPDDLLPPASAAPTEAAVGGASARALLKVFDAATGKEMLLGDFVRDLQAERLAREADKQMELLPEEGDTSRSAMALVGIHESLSTSESLRASDIRSLSSAQLEGLASQGDAYLDRIIGGATAEPSKSLEKGDELEL